MNKKVLAFYDVTGIQDFIFSSTRVKENIGASIYVQELFSKKLINAIKMCCTDVLIDWDVQEEFKINKESVIDSEVIYIGGGNALIAFRNMTIAVEVTKNLTKILLIETNGMLGISVAYHETDFSNFINDREELFKRLEIIKSKSNSAFPLRGIAITHESTDGLPSPGEKDQDNTYISSATKTKIDTWDKNKNYYDWSLPEGVCFPENFDQLGREEGESSYIAVVHVDGNGMGKFIKNQISNIDDYDKAIARIRSISKEIRDNYKSTFSEMILDLKSGLNDDITERLKISSNHLPIRPMILNGDDITFICDGRIGIQLAQHFLSLISKKKIAVADNKDSISACAGVAIVHAHFPFYRAYELAETLCASAKKKAKAINKKSPDSWLDYHIVYGGFKLNLMEMREENYSVPGMDKPNNKNQKYEKSNLLLRPFCISGKSEDKYQFNNIISLYRQMIKNGKDTNGWPRSRMKTLRNAFLTSEAEVVEIQAANKSRGYYLPEYLMSGNTCSDDNIFFEKQTPYFESFELMDFYLPELKLKSDQEDN